MVTIEVVCIDDGLLNGGKEGVSMMVICREIGVIEGGVEWVGAELDTTGANGVCDDIGKMVVFTRMGIYLGLLGDADGLEFLLWAIHRDFDRGLVWCELEGIVNVGLMCQFGGR